MNIDYRMFYMQRLNFLIILNRYYEQKSAKSPSVDGRTGMKYGHKRASEANNFLEDLATKQGEKLPHKAKVMLPTCVTQKNAYEEYVQSHKQPFCFRHFQRIWKEQFPEMMASEVYILYILKINSVLANYSYLLDFSKNFTRYYQSYQDWFF